MESTSALSSRPGSADHVASNESVDSSRDRLSDLYEPIAESLAQVEMRFREELHSRHAGVAAVLRHGTQLGGKRMRPALLLLAAEATGRVNDDHIVLATVIEMVHTATLVHDDVLDVAETRRHVATVNARWNQDTSILLGDFLFAQSFYLAATLSSTEACRWIGAAARQVCEGELRQVLRRDLIELDQSTYVELIRGKTAELCRVACQLGARFCGAPADQVEALGEFGDCVGVAFQIADDYLDLWGDDEAVGKTLGTDISQGKMTLPLIRLLQVADEGTRQLVVAALTGPADQRLQRIRPLLDRSDAADYTRRVACEFRDRSLAALTRLSDSAALRSLRSLAQFSVERRF